MYWDAEEPKEMPSSESLPVVGFRTQCSQSEITKLRAENEALSIERDLNVRQADAYRDENARLKAELAEAKMRESNMLTPEQFRDWINDPEISIKINGKSIKKELLGLLEEAMKGKP